MIGFKFETTTPKLDPKVIDREAKSLVHDLSLHIQSHVKLALVRLKAIATGATLKSVATEMVLDSPSRGTYIRKIIAKETWRFIQSGRAAGRKMPPESAMILWFRALNIPRRAWFPIRLSIARRGIKPRNVVGRALRESRPYIAARSKDAGTRIAAHLIRK